MPTGVGAGKFWGFKGFLPEFHQTCPEVIFSKKKVFMCFSANVNNVRRNFCPDFWQPRLLHYWYYRKDPYRFHGSKWAELAALLWEANLWGIKYCLAFSSKTSGSKFQCHQNGVRNFSSKRSAQLLQYYPWKYLNNRRTSPKHFDNALNNLQNSEEIPIKFS